MKKLYIQLFVFFDSTVISNYNFNSIWQRLFKFCVHIYKLKLFENKFSKILKEQLT